MAKHLQNVGNILPISLAALLLVFSANSAKAEIFKCESAKGKIVYSDTPCHSSSTQTVTDIQATLDAGQNELQPSERKQSSVMRQLDDAVKSAIAREDFVHAEALAVTAEQQGWIAAAKKDAARNMVAGRSEADLIAEQGDSEECRQAKLALEKEADSTFRKPDVLAAKTSLMHVSCGLADDVPPTYVHVNRYSPLLFNPYHYSYRRLGYFPHKPKHAHPDMQSHPHNNSATINIDARSNGARWKSGIPD